MKRYITTLTIAGSDCSGGAGIQADIKTMSALGCYPSSVITGVTVQNTIGVKSVFKIPASVVGEQIEAVLEDIETDCIKIGMVTDKEIIHIITEKLKKYSNIPVIFDPVLISSSGKQLTESDALKVMISELIPRCTLITPNIPEAEILSGIKIKEISDADLAANILFDKGVNGILIKGGHWSGNNMTDSLYLKNRMPYRFTSDKIITSNTHGTGCTLSSAIAAFIARGLSIEDSVAEAKKYLDEALKSGKDISTGHGHGPLNHFFSPQKAIIK